MVFDGDGARCGCFVWVVEFGLSEGKAGKCMFTFLVESNLLGGKRGISGVNIMVEGPVNLAFEASVRGLVGGTCAVIQ